MTPMEMRFPHAGGEMAVLDYGGYGPPVLLVHHPAGNAYSWHTLAPLLARKYRVFACDLPGYAQSTAVARNAFDIADAIVATCKALDLDRPLLVADDSSSYHAALAAIRSDVVGGILMISGFFLNTAESVHAILDLFESPEEVERSIGLAFQAGARVSHPDERDMVAGVVLSNQHSPWLKEGSREQVTAQVHRAFRNEGPHAWRLYPGAVELCAYFAVDRSEEWFPQRALLGRTGVPIHMLVSTDGADGIVATDPTYLVGVPDNVTVHFLAGGFAPRHEIPEDVAVVVDLAADDMVAAQPTRNGD